MLTRNIWTNQGLCNGSTGVVKDVFKSNQMPLALLVVVVIVKFDDYCEISICKDSPSGIPIVPLVSSLFTHDRQLPLKLAWTIIIHKSQGLTLLSVSVDI